MGPVPRPLDAQQVTATTAFETVTTGSQSPAWEACQVTCLFSSSQHERAAEVSPRRGPRGCPAAGRSCLSRCVCPAGGARPPGPAFPAPCV